MLSNNYLINFLTSFILLFVSVNTCAEIGNISELSYKKNINQKKSNGDFYYFYENDKLKKGYSNFSYLFYTKYSVFLEFKSDYLIKINIVPENFFMYSNSYSIDLFCSEIFTNIKNCNINKVYNSGIFKKNPELKKSKKINIKLFFKSISDSEGKLNDNFTTFLETVKLNLEANHFSKKFINDFIETVKKQEPKQ